MVENLFTVSHWGGFDSGQQFTFSAKNHKTTKILSETVFYCNFRCRIQFWGQIAPRMGPSGPKMGFFALFLFFGILVLRDIFGYFSPCFLDFWPSWCQIKYSEDISQCNFTSRSQIKGQRTYIMGLRGSEVAFLGKKIAKIPYCSKGHSNFRCRLLLWRPPPFNFMNKNWLFSPMQRVGVVGLISLESFKVDHFFTV